MYYVTVIPNKEWLWVSWLPDISSRLLATRSNITVPFRIQLLKSNKLWRDNEATCGLLHFSPLSSKSSSNFTHRAVSFHSSLKIDRHNHIHRHTCTYSIYTHTVTCIHTSVTCTCIHTFVLVHHIGVLLVLRIYYERQVVLHQAPRLQE